MFLKSILYVYDCISDFFFCQSEQYTINSETEGWKIGKEPDFSFGTFYSAYITQSKYIQ